MSLSCEPFSPQLTQFDSSSWSQAIIINATSFPFLSGFQTRAQAPASSHQPLPWCQQSSSKQGKDQVGLHQWCKARLCQVWMGLMCHLPPQKFALGLFAKVGLKPLWICGSFPVLLHCFLAKLKDRGACGCAGLAPHLLSELLLS